MIAVTAARVAEAGLFAPPVVVAAAGQAEAIEAALPGLGSLILEPGARNTAPAIALAARAADPDDVLLVLPSDHLIADPAGLREAVRRALPFARDGWILCFGMKAERGETGYGYIERGPALGDGVHQAARFIEKPDAAAAGRYAADGRHDWNGGIFLMRAGTYLDALAAHAPEIEAAARAAMIGARREGRRLHPDAAAFAAAPARSIDYAVMEKADKVAVLPVAIGWSDLGSWEALYDAAGHDRAGNALAGEVIAIDTGNCLIRSEGPLVAAIGVDNLVVIATEDAVLIVPKAQSQRVREVVEALKAQGRSEWT
jgi:mannose-1-phosphate guanylyltransferase/mannose-1-phosphate guanylyltransferase/mannose-6-phosphate isomerase